MCFLKSYYPSNSILSQRQPQDSNSVLSLVCPQKTNNSKDVQKFEQPTLGTNIQGFYDKMSLLYTLVLRNQKMIISLSNKIDQTLHQIQQTPAQDEDIQDVSSQNDEAVKIENFHQILQTDSETPQIRSLKQKIFGERQYSYRIEVEGLFPPQILKERNFSFDVKLCSSQVNPIKLILGVCDNEGNWITSCSSGMDFMKGNCEIEIHHGIGEFRKIYPREVSRGFRDQQVNFVIYPQPNVIKYINSSNRWETYVEAMEVEPLIVQKVCIRAKKVSK